VGCSSSSTASRLLSGSCGPNEFYSGPPDEDLDQAEAYPLMTPICGKGVVFDGEPRAAARR